MKLIQAIESLTRWAGWVGAILIFPLVGALVVEVFSRYVAGRPTLWAFEISYMVMGAMFMLGMANALRIGHHVSVDLVSMQLNAKTNALLRIIGYVLFLPILAWLVWELFHYALQAFNSNERSGRSAWNPIVWPILTVWCIGFTLLALQVVAELLKAVAVLRGQPLPEEDAS
ncbi:TRAP transporter small permease subunit [Halomonas sp. AOP13-D3-9]|uniref:TRAP transporter small permease protein n=1 Tax=Vreelandella titanicae TaxID=664683 RepID=A0A558JAP6_9GAMM|nr:MULTISPECIES: TRAP transporter small permease subunit [Halomonas]MBR9905211.1 TRAP transporter small permease subunit [Gammaproteobacteria bacterium]TVU90693.1 TRAP transporter small permease subunit [Halomonas titanicae]CEP37241.1 TRAP transporter DctQ family protein [Halomonas sp. R57-5]